MHKKTRGKTAYLYRSSWVPKGANNNTHGYAQQTFVGSLPVHACALPDELHSRLTTGACLCRKPRFAALPVRQLSEPAVMPSNVKLTRCGDWLRPRALPAKPPSAASADAFTGNAFRR